MESQSGLASSTPAPVQNKRQETVDSAGSWKPNNMFNVPFSSITDFFKWWFIFLRPFISLTEKEIEVMASFLRHRWELSKITHDAVILDTMVMSGDTKRMVIEECGITLQHFYVVMSALRRKKAILNGIINPKLIPNVREDFNGTFKLLIQFSDKDRKK